jgi:proton glutamate symport protein
MKHLDKIFGASVAIVIFLIFLQAYQIIALPKDAFFAIRLVMIMVGVAYGFQQSSLTVWILVAMLIGGEVGYTYPQIAISLDVLSKIFLKLIKTIIAPLLFATLVVGIAGHGDLAQVGRMGAKSFIYFITVTLIALTVGLIAINLTQAGVGIKKQEQEQTDKKDTKTKLEKPEKTWQEIVLHTFPENIAKSVAEGQVLQIVVFSILFGIALTMIPQKHREHLLHFSEALAETMFKFTNIVMLLAPFAVGGAIAYTIGKYGLESMKNLGMLLLTLYGALIAFVLLVLLPIALLARINVVRFVKAVREPVSLAFATASSESALPMALERMEKFGVPRKIVSFVIPTGYSFNLDGTTLYLSLAAVFVAQAAGQNLSLGTQISMLLLLLLTSKGVAGIPRASLMVLSGAAATFGLEEWPIAMIIGIDALMDMARTSVNVLGNCLASAVIARWEGELGNGESQAEDEVVW